MAAAMRYRALVRCGNLTARKRIEPRVFSGAVWSKVLPHLRLPSQGPAPLSTWGFSLAKRFCVASTWMDTLPAGNREDGKESRKMARRTTLRCQREYHGISAFLFTGLAGYSWNQAQQATQSRFPDRTPRVSSEPEWAAREKTQPAHGSPCATGAACQIATAASWGRVVTSNAQPIESLPPGALGGSLMVCGHGLRAPRADLGFKAGSRRVWVKWPIASLQGTTTET